MRTFLAHLTAVTAVTAMGLLAAAVTAALNAWGPQLPMPVSALGLALVVCGGLTLAFHLAVAVLDGPADAHERQNKDGEVGKR